MHKERLLKLAEGLETLNPEGWEWDFRTYGANRDCGHVGCAIGWCPVIFPDEWLLTGSVPYLHGTFLREPVEISCSVETSGMRFFCLNHNEFRHLFIYNTQDTYTYGGKDLDRNATRTEVADNIRAFVAKMETNEENP